MSNIKEKLESFEKTIMEDAEKQSNEILAEFEAKKKQIASEMENKARREAEEKLKAETEKLERKANEEISGILAVGKRELLVKRQEIMDAVFEKIENKINEYRKTDEYFQYLKGKIHDGIESVGQGDIVVYLDKSDAGLKDAVEKEFSVKVEFDLSDIKGGARVCNITKNVVCDNTIVDRLIEERDKFLEISGLNIGG
ncbi:MAG: V-type ATP synthase subunit E [Bacillota bacterium]|nr:V-type ATP synthase subunit E [Bacillota bacterium]